MIKRIIHAFLFLVAWVACTIWTAYSLNMGVGAPPGYYWFLAVPLALMEAGVLAVIVACAIYYIREGL